MNRHPKEIEEYIRENVKGKTTKELLQLINEKFGDIFTESSLRAYKTNHHMPSGTPTGNKEGTYRNYSKEIHEFILKNCTGIGSKAMAEMVNRTFGTKYTQSQMKSYYGNHHINSGLTGYFEKGAPSHNKGKKGLHFDGSEKGWFQKGHEPTNHREVGSERVDADGYTLVKIKEPKTWAPKHKLLWEKEYGKIPKGSVLIFLDGNKNNITMENLAVITMEENLALNRAKLRSENQEHTNTGILIVRVKAAIKRRKTT